MFQNKKPVIAIDGTAGSGKGTLAKKLALYFSFDHLDSGILYRIFAYELLKQKINFNDLEKVKINFKTILMEKKFNPNELRTDEVTKVSSEVAQKEFVRKKLILIQREFCDNPPSGIGSVIDGRDITSVIAPKAEVKFYIDADLKIRAKRRLAQLDLDHNFYDDVLKKIKNRDAQDKKRKLSPLLKTPDSYLIDTTNLNEDESLQLAINYIKKNQILFSDCI
jgi:cytidylate kinase|tara:strand:+ start:1894 stop:2559 length:666 start_codon:yes stop_codon:yes gene_type:complete